MALDYDSIRADNKRRYGTDIGRIGPILLADRYDDRTHFIFELLQNAEDALARRNGWKGPRAVKFALSDSSLQVSHFGMPFNEADVRGICGIAESTKSLTAIGRFGIGFKSVYAFTDRPEVHSGTEDFAIESFVWPIEVPTMDRNPDETVFVLPLRAGDPVAAGEIAAGLQRLGPRILLFLREIEEISWSIESGASGLYLRSKPERIGETACKTVLIAEAHGIKEVIEESWIVFFREVHTKNGRSAGHAEIAFALRKQDNSDKLSIRAISDSPLVVFFPTVLSTHLGFLVQGPYRTTPSRDNVPRSDPWNQYLVRETAQLLTDALRELRDLDILDTSALRSLPLDRSKFGIDSMFSPFFEAVSKVLSAEPLLPSFHGGYVAARHAKLARTQELRELFSPAQLGTLYEDGGELAWLSADITQDRTPDLRQYLMRELGIAEVTPETILPKLGKAFLENQPDDWINLLYEFLLGQPVLMRRLVDVPVIRLEDGSHVTAKENGQPKAFLPSAIPTGFPTVRRAVCSTSEARKFLESLGLTEPDPVDDVIWNVLPRYAGPEVDVREEVYDPDIRRILTAFATDSKVQREKLVTALRETTFVVVIDAGDGSKWVSKPGEVYLATQRLKELFDAVGGIFLVDDSYPCLKGEDVRELLEASGATRYLQPVSIKPEFTWEECQEMRRSAGCENSSRGETFDDWTLRGLDELLATLPTCDAAKAAKKAELLWEALRDMEERRGTTTFSGTYWWSYHYQRSYQFDATFVRKLNEVAWVPDSKGLLQPPGYLIFEDTGWKPFPFLLTKIRFKPPVIESLAREAGFEPGVLDLLKKLGLTSEAELRARLGIMEPHPKEIKIEEQLTTEEALHQLGITGKPTPLPEDISKDIPFELSRQGDFGTGRKTSDWGGSSEAMRERLGHDVGETESSSFGEKRSVSSRDGGGQRTFVSYVGVHPDDEEPDPDGLSQEQRLVLEEKAIEIIVGRERHLQRTPKNNPGFDLFESGAGGRPIKWIEVKAMKGDLHGRPVGLSHTQFECAREHGDAYWLYVVEYAGEQERARVVRIQDPAGKAKTFTFDRGWFAVAEIDGPAESTDQEEEKQET